MLHHAIDKAAYLQVIQEMPDGRGLPEAIVSSNPQWVIIPTSFPLQSHSWIEEYPQTGFIFFSPGENRIKLGCQTFIEEQTDLSLKDLILILEKDLQHP
jgi:hypothetical protein